MNYSLQLMMALPELVLAIGAVFLLLVAAWGGTQSTKLVSWTAIAVLIGAGIALAGPASAGGEAFGGLYRPD
ncbi:NADH-quinone oxidoreductase subunit N, partial [Escherichia coli]|nr:NADH-quinone oxidoreductase subunit N [Escherichia coli]